MFNYFNQPLFSFREYSAPQFIPLFALMILVSNAWAGDVSLAWDPSTSANIDGYKVYYGRSSENYTGNIDVGLQTSTTITGLDEGVEYYFATTSYNLKESMESQFSNEVSARIPNPEPISVDFSANQISGEAPLLVNFTTTTTGEISTWTWDFGDPSIANSSSPNNVVTYANPGVYSVSLTVTGPNGNSTETKQNFITVTEPVVIAPPIVNFSAAPKSGPAPLSVDFTNTSKGEITTHEWDFGDGASSSGENPTHTYSQPGSYTVRLTETGPGGSTIKTITDLIQVASTEGSEPPQPSGQENGLVAAFGFEENDGNHIQDSSGLENHGVISGATRTEAGRYGKALRFNGSDSWVTVAHSESLNLSQNLTLEAWVLPTTLDSWNTVLLKESSSGLAYALYANDNASRPSGYVRVGNDISVQGNAQLALHEWTHLALTYDGTVMRIYRNGVEVKALNHSGHLDNHAGDLRIGGNSVWEEYFTGLIDEVRIYNRTLNPNEIVDNMNRPIGGAESDTDGGDSGETDTDRNGLVAAYGFEEGNGTHVEDSSEFDNHGVTDGASRTDNGRFGRALQFNGVNNSVIIPGSDSLDLTGSLTIEAWVFPQSLNSWNTIVLKESASGLAYALYANDNAGRPAGYVRIGSDLGLQGNQTLPIGTWTHLALTYDGAVMRLYKDGVQIGSQNISGNLEPSLGDLQFGGNSFWGEYFSGLIDEVRLYNRALSPSEINEDIGIPINNSGSEAVIRINAGGGEYTDQAGNRWSADNGFNTGFSKIVGAQISGTANPTLYQSDRRDSGALPDLMYQFDLPNGSYRVNLHFAETQKKLFRVGKRVFDVEIEGVLMLNDLDIFAEAGARTALIKSIPVTVNDGQLNIGFLQGTNKPKICAIEILR